jgi:hypothetical protein
MFLDDFWNRLQRSRNVRDCFASYLATPRNVVHEGEDVEENDAANTLAVTQEFVHNVAVCLCAATTGRPMCHHKGMTLRNCTRQVKTLYEFKKLTTTNQHSCFTST